MAKIGKEERKEEKQNDQNKETLTWQWGKKTWLVKGVSKKAIKSLIGPTRLSNTCCSPIGFLRPVAMDRQMNHLENLVRCFNSLMLEQISVIRLAM